MAQIQFITHCTERHSYLDAVRLALEGGCRWVQLRMKEADGETLLRTALEAQRLCAAAGATFIIDDHVELVREIRADGVHLGQHDMPVGEARALLGPDFIIGGTANTFEQVRQHSEAGADYIGCGPFRFTTTKKNLSPILGLEGYRDIIGRMRAAHIDLPLVAIGGITEADVPALLAAGVSGIALSGSVLRAADPAAQMRRFLQCANSIPKQ